MRIPRLSLSDWIDALLALPVVILIRCLLWCLPFRAFQGLSRGLLGFAHHPPRSSSSPERVRHAVRRAARVVPAATCLTQALAVHYCLALFGIRSAVHVGVAKSPEGRLLSHAWVEHPGIVLSPPPAATFKTVVSF